MKVIQLNTWSCHLAPAIAQLFEREQPDIVCLQEVLSAESTHKLLGSIQEILQVYPFTYSYYSPLVQFRFMASTAQRGNMILSKFPILSSSEFWTAGEFQADFVQEIPYNAARNVAHCQIDTPHGLVHVLTTHGYHVGAHKLGSEETVKACRQIAHYIRSLKEPVILTGDFNLTSQSGSMCVFDGLLKNLTKEYEIQTTRNYLTTKTEACDFILTRGIEEKSFTVLDDVVSDHKALVAEF